MFEYHITDTHLEFFTIDGTTRVELPKSEHGRRELLRYIRLMTVALERKFEYEQD